MRLSRSLVQLLFLLATGCAGTTIPQVQLSPGATTLRAGLPVLAPCVLVHADAEQPMALAVEEGTGSWPVTYATVLVPHPSGLVAIDPGVGRDVTRDLAHVPLWFRLVMGDGKELLPLGATLHRAGVSPAEVKLVLVTHVHWDHVGGLRDLPEARLLLSAPELAFASSRSGRLDHGTMPFQLDPVRSRLTGFPFDGPAHEGFAASRDLLGDGSIVAVSLPGHTPGSAGYLVSSGDGRRWLFVGDAAWVREGIERPAAKSALVSPLVDGDRAATARTLGLLHAFHLAHPEVQLVVSHDRRSYEGLAPCAAKR